MTGKPCIRCLLSEIPDEAALAEAIRERIAALAEEEKAQETEWQRRLDICKSCQKLNRGTCGACGCYVELRAARIRQTCPDVPDRWKMCEKNITK